MGAGASTLARLRKAIVIKSYNLRQPNETVDEQFRKYAHRSSNNALYITTEDVRRCLGMEAGEYGWVDDLLKHSFGNQTANINYFDFIRFLESGRPPELSSGGLKGFRNKPQQYQQLSPDSRTDPMKLRGTGKGGTDGGGGTKAPPFPPHVGNSNHHGGARSSNAHTHTSSSYYGDNPNSSIVDASSITITPQSSFRDLHVPVPGNNNDNDDDDEITNSNNNNSKDNGGDGKKKRKKNKNDSQGKEDELEEEEEEDDPLEDSVININLSNVKSTPLPASVKLAEDIFPSTSANAATSSSSGSTGQQLSEATTVIIHPSRAAAAKASSSSSTGLFGDGDGEGPRPLWRKREVVRQERTVHYTTIDDQGEQQELVEKETTQSEVLHMECKETGEFAHRETTRFEQCETFNEEVVNEVEGAEEYVHLKSLEDEFHYMESTMPPKEGEGEAEAPPPTATAEEEAAAAAAGADGVHGEDEEMEAIAAAARAAQDAAYEEAYQEYVRRQQQEQHQQDTDGGGGGGGGGGIGIPPPSASSSSAAAAAAAAMMAASEGLTPEEAAYAYVEEMMRQETAAEGGEGGDGGVEGNDPPQLYGEVVHLVDEADNDHDDARAAVGQEDESEGCSVEEQEHKPAGLSESDRQYLFAPTSNSSSNKTGSISRNLDPVNTNSEWDGENPTSPSSTGQVPVTGSGSANSSSSSSRRKNSPLDADPTAPPPAASLPPRSSVSATASEHIAGASDAEADANANADGVDEEAHLNYLSRTSSYESLHEID